MQRPSNRELYNKIKQGKELVSKDKFLLVDPDVIASDATELGYQVANLKDILATLLDEIHIMHYVGGRPPQKSYKSIIEGSELVEFRWISTKLGCDVYLKYCLKGDIFYLVSLHKHRPTAQK
jgi:hypothetical protein